MIMGGLAVDVIVRRVEVHVTGNDAGLGNDWVGPVPTVG